MDKKWAGNGRLIILAIPKYLHCQNGLQALSSSSRDKGVRDSNMEA